MSSFAGDEGDDMVMCSECAAISPTDEWEDNEACPVCGGHAESEGE